VKRISIVLNKESELANISRLIEAELLDEAGADCQSYLKKWPKDPEGVFHMALIAQKQGDLPQSLQHLQRAVKMNKISAKYFANLGSVLFMLGRTSDAAYAYEKALEIDVQHLVSLNNLGVIYSITNRNKDAEALLLRSVNVDPTQIDAWLNLCSTIASADFREADAVNYAGRAIALAPKDPRGYRYLARALLHQGNPLASLNALEKAAGIDPRNPDNHCSIGICHAQLEQIPESVRAFQTALAIDPNHGDTYYSLAVFLYELDELGAATEAAQRALEFHQDKISCEHLLSKIFFAQERFQEAMDCFVRSRDLQKNYLLSVGSQTIPDNKVILAAVDSVENWCKENHLPYRETVPNTLWQATNPIIFGGDCVEGQVPSIRIPHSYIAEISDVTVIPEHEVMLVDSERTALYDRLIQMQDWRSLREDNIVPLIANDHLLINAAPLAKQIVKAGIFLFSEGWYNYAHWLIEQLPRLYSVEKDGVYAGLPLLVNEGLFPQQLESLRLVSCGQFPIQVLSRSCRHKVERLIYPTNLTAFHKRRYRPGERATAADGAVHPEAVQFLRERLLPQCAAESKPHRRLWLSRKGQTKMGQRRLVNEAEIEALFMARGFESVATESLGFEQQVKLFAEAKMIAGPGGAAMMNIVFAPPGCKTLIFTKKHPQVNFHYFTNIGQIIGHEVAHVCGNHLQNIGVQGFETDFVVNIDIARQALRDFMGL
jgi:tetratricopeptide (TPR) repeat protein